MHILHVNSEISWRGGEQQMANLILELKKLGHQNTIAARKDSESIKFARTHSLNYIELDIGGTKLRASAQLKRFLKQQSFDLIHTHTANAHTIAVYANFFKTIVPIIVSKRTDFPVKSSFKFRHKSVKKILCVSRKIKEVTLNTCPGLKEVHTVYSGIDTSRFDVEQNDLKTIYGIDQKKILVGNCSAIAPHKDYPTFIKTAKKLNELFPEKYHFIIIGDGPLEAEIKDLAKDIDNITFTGFLGHINKVLKSLDIFLMTSEKEGLGTSLLDAMICKIPIVATDAGGIPEIVKHQHTGHLAKVKDSQALASYIEQVSQGDQYVENAYKMVLENFTRQATAQKTFNHYIQALEQVSST